MTEKNHITILIDISAITCVCIYFLYIYKNIKCVYVCIYIMMYRFDHKLADNS